MQVKASPKLCRHEGVHGSVQCPSSEQVQAGPPELPRAGAYQDEGEPSPCGDQTVDDHEKIRDPLDFINDDTLRTRFCLYELPQTLGSCGEQTHPLRVEQIEVKGICEAWRTNVDFPVPRGPNRKKLSCGGLKNLSMGSIMRRKMEIHTPFIRAVPRLQVLLEMSCALSREVVPFVSSRRGDLAIDDFGSHVPTNPDLREGQKHRAALFSRARVWGRDDPQLPGHSLRPAHRDLPARELSTMGIGKKSPRGHRAPH